MNLPYRGSGEVFYINKDYQCDLYYNEELGGIVVKINVNHKKFYGNFLELPLEIPYLCGQLNTGFRFTLIKLTRTGMEDQVNYGRSVYTFDAKYILNGIGKKDESEQTFYKVKYTISNIIEWGQESVYKIGDNYELIDKNKEIRKTIYSNDTLTITYVVSGSSFPLVDNHLLQERIEILQSGAIEIEFKKEKVFEHFNEVFKKVKGLIEIAILKRVNIAKITAYSHKISEKIGELSIDRPIYIYGENINKNDSKESLTNRHWKWISLAELIELNSFSHYFDKHEKLEPIIDLFLEPFSITNISEIRVFLNIVQALETYHSRFITNDIKKFKSNIDYLVSGRSSKDSEDIRVFMMANSKKFITLESRIAELLLANWKIHFDTGDIKRNNFPETIAASRNYYIHYDEDIKKLHRVLTEEELQIYNCALIQMLEYYILLEIGFSEKNSEIKNKLTNRWGNISQSLELIKLSRKEAKNINQNIN